jgi:hypothetical protein
MNIINIRPQVGAARTQTARLHNNNFIMAAKTNGVAGGFIN